VRYVFSGIPAGFFKVIMRSAAKENMNPSFPLRFPGFTQEFRSGKLLMYSGKISG
jgi:hypothetical protein